MKANGDHFGFSPFKSYACTFERVTLSYFLIYIPKTTKQLRNQASLSTVTDLLQMTQLLGGLVLGFYNSI